MGRGLVSSRGRNLKPTCVPLKHRSSPTDFLYPLCLAATSTICGSPILFPFSRFLSLPTLLPWPWSCSAGLSSLTPSPPSFQTLEYFTLLLARAGILWLDFKQRLPEAHPAPASRTPAFTQSSQQSG